MKYRQDLAILFWFYKEPTVVLNRLKGIRRVNPNVPIFGVYGGKHSAIGQFSSSSQLLDDLWVHPEMPEEWAWRNGDLMLTRWYTERGYLLDWQQVFVHQWDLLTTIPVQDFVISSHKEILLTGVRSLDEIADHWIWVQPWSIYYGEFKNFCSHPFIEGHSIWACIFIFAIFTRAFLTDFAKVVDNIPGFIEYRIPTVARILGYSFAPCEVCPDWDDHGDPFLNGCQREVSIEQVRQRFRNSNGIMFFHPVYGLVPWNDIGVK